MGTNQTKAVSIAMCTYNGEKYIAQQLDSIINQTYQNITEIVCIDDCSTDNTWNCLQRYAKQDARFKIIKNEKNLGYIKNFENAILLTNNEFIAVADQDDIWMPNKIEELINAIGKSLLVYSDNEYIDENGNSLSMRFSDIRKLGTCTSCLNFAIFNGISGHTLMFNRKLLDYALPFNKDLPYDMWLAFHAVQQGDIPYVNLPLVKYRQHQNNAIGGVGIKRKYTPPYTIEQQLKAFSVSASYAKENEKVILKELSEIINGCSFKARLQKVTIFWKNRNSILFFKKRNDFRNKFYAIKMFWKRL